MPWEPGEGFQQEHLERWGRSGLLPGVGMYAGDMWQIMHYLFRRWHFQQPSMKTMT